MSIFQTFSQWTASTFSALGTIAEAKAANAAGKQQGNILDIQAKLQERKAEQLEQAAGQERAVAQRNAIGETKQSELVQSRAKAVAGASGGGSLDPTVVDILGDIGAEGAYRSAAAVYEGEEAALGREYAAKFERAGAAGSRYAGEYARAAGKAAMKRGYLAAFGTLASGSASAASSYKGTIGDSGGSLYEKYGSNANNSAGLDTRYQSYNNSGYA